MNWRAIGAIVRKDLKVVRQNKGVMIPLIIVPLLLFAILPALVAFAPLLGEAAGDSLSELSAMTARMPGSLQAELAGYDLMQQFVVLFLVYFMAPMYLIIPLMVASVIAADSFAGEKERKTLEALLYTPTTDRELFVAKLLAAWLPAVIVGWIGFGFYALVANLSAWPTMGELLLPNAMWLLLAFWVGPAAAGLGLGAMVFASLRAQGFQDAYQIGSVVVLPVVLLVLAQATGVMVFSVGLVFLLGLVLWLLDGILLWAASHSFRRGELIARL